MQSVLVHISLLIQTRLFHWRKRYYELRTRVLDESNILQVKMSWWMHFLWKQLFTSEDVNWWTGVVWIACGLLWCFISLFGLSIWRHPFTAEDPLVSKWCNATFLQIWWRNKLISWMAWRWINFQQIFIFKKWVTRLQIWPKWSWCIFSTKNINSAKKKKH